MENDAQSILRFKYGEDWKDKWQRVKIFFEFLGNESWGWKVFTSVQIIWSW